jgi:hypothetical protein
VPDFNWIEDLKELLGDAADYVPIVSSADEIARGDWGGAATAPFASAGQLVFGLPAAMVKGSIGTQVGLVKAAGSALGGDPDEARRMLRQEGRQTWEETAAHVGEGSEVFGVNVPQVALELATDPTNWITGGMSGTAANLVRQGIPEAGSLGRRVLPAVAGGIEGFNLLNNTLPEKVLDQTVGRGARIAKRGIESRFPTAFEYAPRSRVKRKAQDARGLLDEQLSARGLSFKGMLPAVAPDARKSLAPIDYYDAPPFLNPDLDSGTPSRLKQQARESWDILRGQTSNPTLPGINTPGVSPAQQGQATFAEGQRPGDSLSRLMDRIRGDQTAGFVNIPRGGYQEPGQVRIDEENLVHMGRIMAAVMTDIDNEVSNQMFAPIRRAALMSDRMSNAVADVYGPGATPFMSAAYDELKKQYPTDVPDIRFLLSWGWPEGTVGTERLDKIQRRLASKKGYTIEDAHRDIIKGLSKGSPEIMETAGAMGGGPWLANIEAPAGEVVSPHAGPYAPQGINEATGRAEIPGAFASHFAKNQEAFDRQVDQLFPGLQPAEREVVRQISIEALYDEVMNAAGDVSGGSGGATTLFTKGDNPAAYLSSKGGRKDAFSKLSAIPSDDPADIGNRAVSYILPGGDERGGRMLSDVERFGKPNKKGLRPSFAQLNKAEYEELTGKKATLAEFRKLFPDEKAPKGLNSEHVERMVRAVGGTGFHDNPTGGIMPNTQRLLDWYNVGKDILVGDNPAKEWYDAAVREVMDIVGPGRYEDAMMLLELLAVTSSGTGVEMNARNALYAFAEWKLGSDDFIRQGLGLSAEEADALLNKASRWSPMREKITTIDPETGKAKKQPRGFDEDDMFMSSMAANQKQEAGRLMQRYADSVTQREAFSPTQGGPKTNNFAGSFVIKLWKDAVDYSIPDGPLRQRIQSALDEAASIYTVDRHDTRLSHQATAVTDTGAIIQREARLLMAKQLPEVRPEDIQASLWYYSKSRQGFLQVQRDDDMASMLRKVWNDKKKPELDASIRARIREEHPDISEDDLKRIADDLMRQEAVFAILKERLGGNPDIAKALGSRDVSRGLFDLGNDALGVINRAGQGITPRRRVSTAVTELVSMAEGELARIRSGESFGNTIGWDGQQFVPEDPQQGFAVALDSAGRAVSTAKRKTSARDIEDFLGKYAEMLDEPGMSERVKFGLFQMDDPSNASFDLTLIVPDEARAVALAKQFNQKAIFDIGGMRVIDTGGSGEPVASGVDDIRRVVEDVFGPAQRESKSLDEVRKRGVTLYEMDSVNPVSILQRRVIQPIMEGLAERSRQSVPKRGRIQTPGGAVLDDEAIGGTDVIDFDAIGQDPYLSTQGNILANEVIDGEKYGTRLKRYFDEAEADFAIYEQSGVTWGPELTLEERLQKAGDNDQLKEVIRKYDKEGVDIGYADPRAITSARITRDIAKAEGVDIEDYSTMDLLRAAWGEQMLFTPKYLTSNLQGAWLANAFAGVFRVGTPSEFLAAFKLERGGRNDIDRKAILDQLVGYHVLRKWGFEDIPGFIQQGGIRSQTSRTSRGRASGSAMGELTHRVTRNRRLGRAVGRPFQAQGDMSQAIETVMRLNLFSTTVDREMTAAMAVVEDSINAMAVRQGLDDFEFSILRTINPVPGGPTPKRLADHLVSLGFTDGYAKRAARNFAEAKNIAEKVGKKELDKRQFSYDRTNLDEFVGKFIPFHYYFSRAIPYYGEELLRHPIVLVSYMRANQGIEDAQNDPGLSARQKGFLRLMGTPLGFSLLMNPDALMSVVKIFSLDNTYEPEGQTEAGGVIDWLKMRGMGLYPWVDGVLNLMGVYGDTIEPDMLGIRHKSLIGATVNFMRSQLGMEPMDAPYAQAMGQLRWNVSQFVAPFTPDWLSQPVPPKAGGSQTDATFDTIIESRVIARNPNLTNGELLDIMTDQEHPEYIAAFRDASTAGLLQQFLNFSLPVSFKMREDSRDVRNAQVSTIYQAAQEAGVSPTEFRPSMGDAEFAARYKQLTGKNWEPGDYQNAKSAADLVRATPEAKPFLVQQQEYYNLGGLEANNTYQKYQDIRNGKDPQTAWLDPVARQEVADLWADKNGSRATVDHVRNLRDGYEKTHPDFAQYISWRDQMYDLQANLGGDLTEYRRQAVQQNPNAAQYFRTTLEYIKQNYPQNKWAEELERRTLTADAYQAITGRSQMRQDPAPLPGVPPMDVTLPTMGPAMDQGGGYQDNSSQLLANVASSYGYNQW